MASEDEKLCSLQKPSIKKNFDELWFCYSPVHQVQQYYRNGLLDNCRGKWSAFMDSLFLRTKRASEVKEILEARDKAKPHIWQFRTPKEASAFWKKLYANIYDMK
ncbi:hypothetical protein M5689_022550 [Euphorbia peplus]|nr:hypothetical protein M5689_022550 [Euphorbia peplus]